MNIQTKMPYGSSFKQIFVRTGTASDHFNLFRIVETFEIIKMLNIFSHISYRVCFISVYVWDHDTRSYLHTY
jgi:hypothetical protein